MADKKISQLSSAGVILSASLAVIVQSGITYKSTVANLRGTQVSGVNLGSGLHVYSTKSGTNFKFRTLLSGTNITLTSAAGTITINAALSGAGEVNVGANIGSGKITYAGKSGVTLKFKSFVSGTNVTLTSAATTISVNATVPIKTVANISVGKSIYKQVSGTIATFRTLHSGSNITLTSGVGSVTVNAINTFSNTLHSNHIGSPTTLTTLESFINHSFSGGVTDGALLTNNGNGTINLTSSETILRESFLTTITRSGTIATATTAIIHGFKVGDTVLIAGANQTEYNGFFVVTSIPISTTFTFTVTGSPVTPATGTIHSVDEHSPLIVCNIASQTNISLTDGSLNYVYAQYNSGSPNYAVTTNINNFNCLDKCIAYTIVRDGNTLFWVDARAMNVDANRKDRRRLLETVGFQHVLGGSLLAETGTRNFSVTAGAFYYGLTKLKHDAFNTSATSTFTYYHLSTSSAWVKSASQTQINNTQYNNGTAGLATLGAGNYGVHWIYLILDNPNQLAVQYGTSNYGTLALARASTVPTPPPVLTGVGVLLGRIIIQKSDAAFTQVDTAFGTSFQSASALTHNGLAGLNGGTTNEYYHFTSAEHASLSGYITIIDSGTT